MKITAIKKQVKNPNRVSVFVDSKYSFSLNLDQLLEYKITKNQEVDELEIKKLKKASDDGKIKQRTIEWLLKRPHSAKELYDYLYKKQINTELKELWTEEFIQKGYLNEEYFAKWFAENRLRKNKSHREVTAELRSKGIEADIINSVLDELDKTDENSLNELINKLSNRSRYKDQQKLIQYLLSKGFSYSDIKDALKESQD